MKASPTDIDAILDNARKNGLTFTVRGVGGVLLDENTPTVQPAAPVESNEPKKPDLLASVFVPPNVWLVGVETRSESNKRVWQERSNRTKAARNAVMLALARTMRHVVPFAEHYQAGGALKIVFTRLAPHKLDPGNVSGSLKAVEDAVAQYLGANDGDARWQAEYQQERSERMGVRITMGLA